MDQDRARTLLLAERDDVQGLLKGAETAAYLWDELAGLPR